jgi:hypothetical protein
MEDNPETGCRGRIGLPFGRTSSLCSRASKYRFLPGRRSLCDDQEATGSRGATMWGKLTGKMRLWINSNCTGGALGSRPRIDPRVTIAAPNIAFISSKSRPH